MCVKFSGYTCDQALHIADCSEQYPAVLKRTVIPVPVMVADSLVTGRTVEVSTECTALGSVGIRTAEGRTASGKRPARPGKASEEGAPSTGTGRSWAGSDTPAD